MTYVVTEACINCKFTECVEVCPADCFYEGPNMLVIEPLGCVDCGLCVPECPVDAIVPENELSDSQKVFLELNAGYAAIWPNIIEAKAPLDDAEQWSGVSEKKQFLAIEEPLLD